MTVKYFKLDIEKTHIEGFKVERESYTISPAVRRGGELNFEGYLKNEWG